MNKIKRLLSLTLCLMLTFTAIQPITAAVQTSAEKFMTIEFNR